jgi:hypothetical protein
MPEKKDDLAELIERIEITLSMREKLEDYQGEYDKEFEVLKKIVTYLKELQEARKTFRKTHEMLNMWDDL